MNPTDTTELFWNSIENNGNRTSGGEWFLVRKNEGWAVTGDSPEFAAETIMDGNIAWKLFQRVYESRQ